MSDQKYMIVQNKTFTSRLTQDEEGKDDYEGLYEVLVGAKTCVYGV